MKAGGVHTRMGHRAARRHARRRPREQRRKRAVELSVIGATVIAAVVFSTGSALAYWVFSTNTSLPTAAADALPPGGTPTAAIGSSATPSVTVTFPVVHSRGGTAIAQYAVIRLNAYTHLAEGPISGPCTVGATTVSCVDSPGIGAWNYVDQPRFGTNWVGQKSTPSNVVYLGAVSTISPAEATAGSTAQVSVRGFAARKPLSLTVGGTSAAITSGQVTGTGGTATVTFVIPAGPGGPQRVVVSDGTNSAAAPDELTVAATVGLSTSSGPAGTTGVTLSGRGYAPGTAVSASSGGSPLNLDPTNPLVGSGGAWSATFTVPNTTQGVKVITVRDAAGTSSSINFTVTAPTAAAATVSGPDPTGGSAGLTGVTIRAQGFVANHVLVVTVGGSNATITSGGTTDGDGGATLIFTIPMVPAGPQTVVVSDGTNTATAPTPFTVQISPSATAPTTTASASGVDGCVAEPDTDCAGADLRGADFAGANLAHADFAGADLTDVNFAGADLHDASLAGADLAGVIWTNAICPDGTVTVSDDATCMSDLGLSPGVAG